jgi:hypothetical protein
MEIELTQKEKARILFDAGHCTTKALSSRGNIPERSARRYVALFSEGQSSNRKNYAPREKSKYTSKIERKVIRKAQERTKVLSLREIGAFCGISHELTRQILRDNDFLYCSYQKNRALTEDDYRIRLDFAHRMLERESDWGFVVFTDETTFWLNKCVPNKVWTRDPSEEEGGAAHGPKLQVWGGITTEGALTLEIFEGTMDGERYLKILKKKAKEMHRLFPDGFIFHQDGHPVHFEGNCIKFINRKMPGTLMKPEFPCYSPDLNPIENVWAWLKGQVSKSNPQTVRSMKRSINLHWKKVTKEFLQPYFDSMPDRMLALIENGGRKIKY